MSYEIKEIKKYVYRDVEFPTYEEATINKKIDEHEELSKAIELLGGDMEEHIMFDAGSGIVLLNNERVNKAKEIFVKIGKLKYPNISGYEECVRELLRDKRSPKKLYKLYLILESIFNHIDYGWVRVGQPYFKNNFGEVNRKILKDLSS